MDDKIVWDALMTGINNPYGVAGVMGNLMAESSMRPACITGKTKYSSAEYVERIKSGKMTEEVFSHDSVAFGLAQWRFWTRKQALLRFTGAENIDNPVSQIEYLLKEIAKYKKVWPVLLSAKTVREASDVVLTEYENPAGQSEAVKEKRAAYGQKFFDQFAVKRKMVVTTADRVLLRKGNGKDYKVLTRAEKSGTMYYWVATAENGWRAVEAGTSVAWISPEFSKIV